VTDTPPARPVRGGLTIRLMGAFALLAVTPTLLLGGLAISRARSDVQVEVVRGNLALIRAVGQQLNATLQDTRRALEVTAAFLAQDPDGGRAAHSRTARTLRALGGEFPILRQVTYLDRQGKRIEGDTLDPEVRFSLDLANTFGGYVSEVLHGGGRRQVLVVVQARDRKGELQGFVAGVVDLSFVQSRLSEARLGKGAALLVVDGNARVVAHSGQLPPAPAGQSLRRSNAAVDRMLASHREGHLVVSDARGERWVAVYRNIAGMSEFRGVRWGVLLMQPTVEAFALARMATRDTVLVAAAVLLLALAVGAYLARRITRPLARLVRQTELVADENFDEAAFDPPRRTDEIGVLAESFARMVQRLARSREDLYALTEFRENLVRSIPVGVISVDREGVIWSVNPAQEQLSDVTAAEAARRPVAEVFPERSGDEPVLGALAEVLSGGGATDLTLNNARTPFTAEPRLRYRVRLAPLRDRRGQVNGAVILQEDLSDTARLEAQLLRSEKLSSVGVLAAGVAHEINNPLTTVLGYAKLLLEGRPEDDPDRAALELVADEARRVQEIVRNLLDFSRQEPGQVGPIVLGELMERTLSLVAPDLRKRQVEVERALSPELPAALADARRMEQVLVNLITNAAHAMAGGGTLTVATGRDRARPDEVYLEVRDTGRGIAPEDQPRVFDPFFTTKEPGEGTGLGLAVSHGIIEELGGEILLESEPGEGSVFRVWLPAAAGEEE